MCYDDKSLLLSNLYLLVNKFIFYGLVFFIQFYVYMSDEPIPYGLTELDHFIFFNNIC